MSSKKQVRTWRKTFKSILDLRTQLPELDKTLSLNIIEFLKSI